MFHHVIWFNIWILSKVFCYKKLQPPEKLIEKTDKIKFCCYTLRLLLPWLKELIQERNAEKGIEAKIQGKIDIMDSSYFSDNSFPNDSRF